MKTMIAIPCMDTVPVGFVNSLLQLDKPEGTSISFQPNSMIYDARNLLTLTAKQNQFDRVLWLDSDMTFPSNTIRCMTEQMNSGKYDLITGLYFRRTLPTKPVLFKNIEEPYRDENGRMVSAVTDYMDYPDDSVFDIAGCGFGCVMTTVKLLNDVWEAFGPPFAPYPWAGEDISFCYRAGLLGAKMVCDSRIKLGHIGMILYSEAMYERRRE